MTIWLSNTPMPSGHSRSGSWWKTVVLSAFPSPVVSSKMRMRSPSGRRSLFLR